MNKILMAKSVVILLMVISFSSSARWNYNHFTDDFTDVQTKVISSGISKGGIMSVYSDKSIVISFDKYIGSTKSKVIIRFDDNKSYEINAYTGGSTLIFNNQDRAKIIRMAKVSKTMKVRVLDYRFYPHTATIDLKGFTHKMNVFTN